MFVCRMANIFDNVIKQSQSIDFLAPLLVRCYLVPVFWMAANNKWNPLNRDSSLDATIEWFGNTEWGLGLPLPELMAYMAWGTEYFGAILLLLGLAVRWITIPLMITMTVAAVTVHWDNGWLAIAPSSAQLEAARSILQHHGNYEWLTEKGAFVILNNGIEFAATYFIMLLTLFFLGAGKYLSIDYWIAMQYRKCSGYAHVD